MKPDADEDRRPPQLIHGDCLREMAHIEDGSVDAVITDPPYFKVKGNAWDRQWENPQKFLKWLGACVEHWARVLKPNGSLYCFASPKMAARVEVLIGERLNVLNCIRWMKRQGWHNKLRPEDLRTYLTPWEAIVFAEHYGADSIAKGEAGYQTKCDELRGFVFEPLRAYLDGERERAGFSIIDVARQYQSKTGSRTVTGMAGHWFGRVQWALPTEENYMWLRNLFSGDYLRREYEELRRKYDYLRREYEDLRREYEELRRPFTVSKDVPYTDVWAFDTVAHYKQKHPCEKPLDLLLHIITASTRPGAVVLDPFMGSGTTGVACKNLERAFIGIELDKGYFDMASERIATAEVQTGLEFVK